MVGSGFEFHVDPAEWYRLKAELDRFDPALSRGLRRNIRLAADRAAAAVRDVLRESTPGGNPSGPGRDALIAGTRVSVSFGSRAAGARIVTSGSKLPAGHAALLKVYNLSAFRHPVFGDTGDWVQQQGRPYFEKPIEETVGKTMYRDITAALDEAIAAIGGRSL